MGRDPTNELTAKQKAFADNYIKTTNAYQSAVDAGYSVNYAKVGSCKMLENVRIKLYIGDRMEKVSKTRIADANEVLEYLTSVMRGNVKEEELKVLGDKVERFDKEAKVSDRNKAAELLGKRYAIYSEKIDMTLKQVVFNGEDEIED